MSKINKIVRTVKYEFSAPDFTTFTANMESNSLMISNDKEFVGFDMTRDTMKRLKDLCTYVLEELEE